MNRYSSVSVALSTRCGAAKGVNMLNQHDSIQDKADYRSFLQEDLCAHGVTSWRPHYRITRPTLLYQRRLRRVEYLITKKGKHWRALYVVARLLLARSSVQLGISIPPGVFGRGLSIAHYGSIVVNDEARVGKYCRIHSATNIGVSGTSAPVLGDYVYIGPGAVIYGAVTLGDHMVVGANAVVQRSFANPATLGGAPAKVISSKSSGSVMPSWMPRPTQPLS